MDGGAAAIDSAVPPDAALSALEPPLPLHPAASADSANNATASHTLPFRTLFIFDPRLFLFIPGFPVTS
jgi:hypothetical protein